MRFGHFDDERREYVVTRPDTPLPWINYLGCEAFFGLISNTAGGYAFYRDARLRRLTRYRYNDAPLGHDGRYLYIRDDVSGDYWSPNWQPVRRDVEDYECRQGLGYTVIGSAREGIHCETLYLVPLGASLELWRARITNRRSTAATLSVFGAVEFCLWDAWDDATNFQRNYNVGEVEIDGHVIYHKSEYRERRDHFAWFACSESTTGFDTDRQAFLGPYRGWDRPLAVEQGAAACSIAHGWQPVGAHAVRLSLEPGESRDLVFALGYFENPRAAKFDPPGSQTIDKRGVRPVVERWCRPDAVDEALDALRRHWTELLARFQVSTPEPHLDRMVNAWNQYQCMVTFNLSRSASLFESGVGRGIGFRDSNQDLLGFVHMSPERARERLLDIAATQLPSGGAYHQYQPLTKRGNDAVGSGFNDDPLWLVHAVAAYVRETGDLDILDEPVAYDNAAGSEASLYDHLCRAIAYTTDRLGPHGLPLIGKADWNDCLNLNSFSEESGESFQAIPDRDRGVAESVFIAGLFVLVAGEMAELARLRRDDESARRIVDARGSMIEAVERDGWDGAWFRRAYDAFGDPIGSSENAEGRIFIEPQGVCVMAGLGLEDGRARSALAAVEDWLATPNGIVLHAPAFTHYEPRLGEISSYPPGHKENGSVFCHTNPWIMIAEAIARSPERALDYYLRINPSAREAISDVHRCEPYVYAQTIAGREAATEGEAKNSWLTGTAAWNFVAASQWILGVRPEHDGLRIDPRVPASWAGFAVHRRFRGAEYEITVRKTAGVDGRVRRLVVDGVALDGSLVPLPASAGQRIEVEAFVEPIEDASPAAAGVGTMATCTLPRGR